MTRPGGRLRAVAGSVVLAALASVAVMLVSACGAEAVPALRLEPALDGATFEQPVEVGAYPDGRTFVAERGGRVWLVGDDGGRTSLLDLSTRLDAERGEGLLSVALDPAFASNRHVWAYYFAVGEPPRTVLSRLTVPDGEAGDEVDLASELMVMEFDQPGFNQNGGAIR
ncbi:MAG: PQQ-dependent sugar dehydrogenase, partial [Dehalococcoidia bacterium]